jgi:hypothetical protein
MRCCMSEMPTRSAVHECKEVASSTANLVAGTADDLPRCFCRLEGTTREGAEGGGERPRERYRTGDKSLPEADLEVAATALNGHRLTAERSKRVRASGAPRFGPFYRKNIVNY